MLKIDTLPVLRLDMFSPSYVQTNKTTDTAATTYNDLSGEMKIFYSDYLIDMAEPELVHDQFGQKHPIPKNGGKTIEFRKYDPLPKMLTPLSEGVTPNGQKLNMGVIQATINQYGGFIELSDLLILTAIDNNLLMATQLLGSQAGRTLDTITREVLNGGTNVQYGDGSVSSRSALVGGDATPANNHYLTIDAVRKAVRALKVMNTPRINGDYVGIIHPDAAYDLMSDPKWVNVKTYSDPEGIYEGEIGKIEGVRFVESSEAKVWHAENLSGDDRTLTLSANASATKSLSVSQTLTASALVGRYVIIGTTKTRITANTTNSITVADNITASSGATVYPGEAGAAGRDVYSTLILGANAYGVTEITGGGLQHIVKQLGSAGTADPLNQRATAGWKATKVAERLVEAYMIRIETASTFDDAPAN